MSWNRILGWRVWAGREQEQTYIQWDRIRACMGWNRIGGGCVQAGIEYREGVRELG